MADPIRVQLLGPFEVWRGDAPVPPAEWRGRKTRDLLKILLLARGQYVSKDQLVDWLWPDTPPEAAEGNLRVAVSDLRRLLEPDLPRGRDSSFVRTRHEGYHFDLAGPVIVDLIELERAAQASTRPELEAALRRYPGELLEEDPYADWALPERARLQTLRVEMQARLADLALAEGDYAAARAAAEQALERDPGREGLWRALMRAHALSGDRAAALRAFDRCRAALARDLGTDPLPETLALHAQILRGERSGPATSVEAAGMPAASHRIAPSWLYRLGAGGLVLWVLATGGQLALMLAGWLRGSLVTSGDPGAEALPYLLAHPEAAGQLYQQIFNFIPLGLLLLPAYLAWLAALRAAAAPPGRGTGGAAWLGAGLGGLDVLAQTVSRALSLAQVSVLPSAFARGAADQRAVLVTLWDVLRQLSGTFAALSAVAQPLAVGLLCWSTLAAARRGQSPLRWSRALAWSGLVLAVLTLVYSFFPAIPALAGWALPLGAGLALATYAWLLALAAGLWR